MSESCDSASRSVLMLAYYFPPENTSGAQRPFRFAKHLKSHGYVAHVVTCQKQGLQSACKHVFETAAPGNGSRRAEIGRATMRFLERMVLPYSDQLPWAPYAASTACEIAARLPIAAVFSTSPPAGAHMAALEIKRRLRIPWIADFRDPIFGNPFRKAKLGKPYDAMLEGLILRNADVVIANTGTFAEILRQRYPRMTEKIHVIWNGFDPEEIAEPLPIPERNHKVLLHAGSIYEGRHPGVLLDSLKSLAGKGLFAPHSLRVRLIGYLDRNHAWYEKSGFDSLLAQGWVECVDQLIPLEEARREIASADYLLLLDLNEMGAGLQVPAKLFEYLRIGRPILAFTSTNSAVDTILAKAGVPYVCVYTNDPPDVVDCKVAGFLTLPAAPVIPSVWFQRNFNAAAQTEMLSGLLDSIIQR